MTPPDLYNRERERERELSNFVFRLSNELCFGFPANMHFVEIERNPSVSILIIEGAEVVVVVVKM